MATIEDCFSDAELENMANEGYRVHHDVCEDCDTAVHTFGYPCDCGAAEGTKVSYYFLCPAHAAKSGALLRKAGTAETLRLLDVAVFGGGQ
jgi:hypothetical protein